MDKIKIPPQLAATILCLLVFGALLPWHSAHAQAALEPTKILIGTPTTANLGQPITVQAVLADNHNHPISKAQIYFTTEARFLNDQGEIVLAEAVTNSNGQAVTEFENDSSGSIYLRAEFKGDAQYAPANATMQIRIVSDRQVYIEHIGVAIPGYNVPPAGMPMASVQSPLPGLARFVDNLWPTMTGWPVAAVLILVWSMYLLTVAILFRVPAAGGDAEEPTEADPGRLE